MVKQNYRVLKKVSQLSIKWSCEVKKIFFKSQKQILTFLQDILYKIFAFPLNTGQADMLAKHPMIC